MNKWFFLILLSFRAYSSVYFHCFGADENLYINYNILGKKTEANIYVMMERDIFSGNEFLDPAPVSRSGNLFYVVNIKGHRVKFYFRQEPIFIDGSYFDVMYKGYYLADFECLTMTREDFINYTAKYTSKKAIYKLLKIQ